MSEKIRKLAEAIASDLFTPGGGTRRATRLVLMDETDTSSLKPRNLGGWSEKAMADRIEKLLKENP